MIACNYITTLYEQIQNSYIGIPIDYSVLECLITYDLYVLTDVTSTPEITNCAMTLNPNVCNLTITLQ